MAMRSTADPATTRTLREGPLRPMAVTPTGATIAGPGGGGGGAMRVVAGGGGAGARGAPLVPASVVASSTANTGAPQLEQKWLPATMGFPQTVQKWVLRHECG
jgi:hypothetical protein